ncbi:MAG: putative porin [Planctomycetes bacterium]|nr:putative porin [Planctomycetota bacterium]
MSSQNILRGGVLAFTIPMLFSALATSGLAQQAEKSSWSFFGDARLRHESNDLMAPAPDWHRERAFIRLNGVYHYTDGLELGVRAVTGSADNNHPFFDLGNGGLGKVGFHFDRLYLRYQPDFFDIGTLWVGKFGNPVQRNPIYGDLVNDCDAQLEGALIEMEPGPLGPFDSTRLLLGQVVALEQAAGEESTFSMLGWSGASNIDAQSKFELTSTYYFYGDLTPDGSGALLNTRNARSGGNFTSDFGVLETVAAYHFDDFIFTGEYIKNFRAADGVGDTGWALGGLMKTKKGKFYYQYQVLEQDAVYANFAQDDFLYPTNHASHLVGWKKPLSSAVLFHVWAMASKMDESFGALNETVTRIRVALTVKF